MSQQFSLKAVLLTCVLAAIVLAVLGVQIRQEQREAQLVDAIREIGGEVVYGSYSHPASVRVEDRALEESHIRLIKQFTLLRNLNLSGTTADDAAIVEFQQLERLAHLDLSNTAITDAGFLKLGRFKKLQGLCLSGTAVTDKGLAAIQELPSLTFLELDQTAVSDAGLRKLVHANRLFYLDVRGTSVTANGVDQLKRALPHCSVVCDPDL